MGARHVAHVFVPARFVCITLHLFGLFALITTDGKKNSIEVTIYPFRHDVNNELYNAKVQSATLEMDTALVWGILFCIFEMISMTIGSISIESPLFSCVSVAIHFVAAILLFFTIFDGWSYLTYTNYIFWYTSFVPFVLEVLLDIMSYRDTYLYIGKKIVELVRNSLCCRDKKL